MRAFSPRHMVSAVLSEFERRASARLLRRPRTEGLATLAIARIFAETATQGNESVWQHRGATQGMMSSAAFMIRTSDRLRRRKGAATSPIVVARWFRAVDCPSPPIFPSGGKPRGAGAT
jgi:hypothetical protein